MIFLLKKSKVLRLEFIWFFSPHKKFNFFRSYSFFPKKFYIFSWILFSNKFFSPQKSILICIIIFL
jgi:hypothetical protein